MRLVSTALLAAVIQTSAGPSSEPQLGQLLARAGEQVRRFEHDFTLVISDEQYRQHAAGVYHARPQHRRTEAEMLFLWLPDEATWLTLRNVVRVDGREVGGSRTRLNDALGRDGGERLARLRRLVDENARFNIGRAFRNFNYPTLALSFLDPVQQPRFAFTLAGRDRVAGTDSWRVNYVERTRPTVIQGDGADLVSRGAVWIADRDGVVVKTQLHLTIPRTTASALATVEVDYQRDARLGMWVPARMRETYIEMRGAKVYENIGGEATYSNFRRFETSGRILPAR